MTFILAREASIAKEYIKSYAIQVGRLSTIITNIDSLKNVVGYGPNKRY
jgi:hypothetical protein